MNVSKVTDLKKVELEIITNLHLNILYESFLNNFGKDFLKLLYLNLVKSPENIFLVVKDKNIIVGYLVATINNQRFAKYAFTKHKRQLIKAMLKSSLVNPKIAYHIIKWRLYDSPTDKKAELQFIAIDNKFQDKGLGTKLIQELNKEFKKQHIYQYQVSTKSQNINSNRFYLKLNFTKVTTKIIFGDELTFYTSPILKNQP